MAILRMLRYFIPLSTPETTDSVERRVITKIAMICIDKPVCKPKLKPSPLTICIAPRPKEVATPTIGQTTTMVSMVLIILDCLSKLNNDLKQEWIEKGKDFLKEK